MSISKQRLKRIINEELSLVREETKPHEQDRHPPDTPDDRIRLEESPEVGRLITKLEGVWEGTEQIQKKSTDQYAIDKAAELSQELMGIMDVLDNMLGSPEMSEAGTVLQTPGDEEVEPPSEKMADTLLAAIKASPGSKWLLSADKTEINDALVSLANKLAAQQTAGTNY